MFVIFVFDILLLGLLLVLNCQVINKFSRRILHKYAHYEYSYNLLCTSIDLPCRGQHRFEARHLLVKVLPTLPMLRPNQTG